MHILSHTKYRKAVGISHMLYLADSSAVLNSKLLLYHPLLRDSSKQNTTFPKLVVL